jgi:hypothetical protein
MHIRPTETATVETARISRALSVQAIALLLKPTALMAGTLGLWRSGSELSWRGLVRFLPGCSPTPMWLGAVGIWQLRS